MMRAFELKENRYIAAEFKKFVQSKETRHFSDFYKRFGIHHSRFHAILKWADANISGYDSKNLISELKSHGK